MINMDDDYLADDFSNGGRLDLVMLPPGENADALSGQESDASDDMNRRGCSSFVQVLTKLRL